MTYSEKLKDPRWQKKRLEVLSRDHFTCTECSSKENTLHVHHLIYSRGKDPWDYDLPLLVTLCEFCHADIEGSQDAQCAELIRLFKTKLKTSFDRSSCIAFFEEADNISQFMYNLSELCAGGKEDRLHTVLATEFFAMVDEVLEKRETKLETKS